MTSHTRPRKCHPELTVWDSYLSHDKKTAIAIKPEVQLLSPPPSPVGWTAERHTPSGGSCYLAGVIVPTWCRGWRTVIISWRWKALCPPLRLSPQDESCHMPHPLSNYWTQPGFCHSACTHQILLFHQQSGCKVITGVPPWHCFMHTAQEKAEKFKLAVVTGCSPTATSNCILGNNHNFFCYIRSG